MQTQPTWAYGSDLIVAIGQCSDAGSKIISMSIGGGDVSVTEENTFIAFTDADVYCRQGTHPRCARDGVWPPWTVTTPNLH